MNIPIIYNGPHPPPEDAVVYLKEVEKVMDHKFKHISTEESLKRMLIYGTCAMKEDENGQYQYVELRK